MFHETFVIPLSLLPFCDTAVGVPPYRVLPAVANVAAFAHIVFVDFYAEARLIRNLHMTIRIFEDRRIFDVIEYVVPPVVVDAEALFLDDGVIACRIYLQA